MKWYGSANGEHGFTGDAMNAICVKVNKAKKNQKELLYSLMVDEMATRKYVEWGVKKLRGC